MVGGSVARMAFFFRFLNLISESLASLKRCTISTPLVGQGEVWARSSECLLFELEIKIGKTEASSLTARITLF